MCFYLLLRWRGHREPRTTQLSRMQQKRRQRLQDKKRRHLAVVVFVSAVSFIVPFHLTMGITIYLKHFHRLIRQLGHCYNEETVTSTNQEMTKVRTSIRKSGSESYQPGFLTTTSGCRIARWVYPTGTIRKRYRDCTHGKNKVPSRRLLRLRRSDDTTTSVSPDHRGIAVQIQRYDTIYVTIQKLPLFVEEILPLLEVDIVLISGQIHKLSPIPANVIHTILTHPHVLHWFCQNLDTNVFGTLNHDDSNNISSSYLTVNGNLSPFPYGLKEVIHKHDMRQEIEAFDAYQHVYEESLELSMEMTTITAAFRDDELHNYINERKQGSIYWGPIGGTTKFREQLPGFVAKMTDLNSTTTTTTTTTRLSPLEFYRNMAKHQFVVSPVGDRTETYRHYEALGLGTIPIILLMETDHQTLSTAATRLALQHLRQGPALLIETTEDLMDEYNQNWTHLVKDEVAKFLVTSSQQQHHQRHLRLSVNRDMVLESYWMHHMEQVVGRKLGWASQSR